ncbi:ribonuclease H-like domain-containing protein [Colletotrichum phormii]|uniref:Ribonuclease H-like domain-containing protein n=1 Tax=Colletotrichum phormii TaxID=359342 RepID=A0AAJ0EBH3_9PEZI|nr:ribonuclease H-like domain-containing protein [Colletotrichum phormii]KAK1633637.1 ribonuclease H-like domain-containing protein [Colletotrichum phormii]
MEVSSENFWRQLPKILLSIAKSNFVAIDLEMTGITDKSSENRPENPTNQQIYESAKKIASKFNVFEMGITCIQHQSGDHYKTETYSFTVSPYLHTQTRADEKFVKELDRNLSVSYNTLKFLQSEGIRLEKIYDDCVPYLSRKDARLATRQMKRRQEPWDVRDHGYNEHDEGLTTFCVYKRMSVYEQIVRIKARELVPQMGCRLWNHGTTVVISQGGDGQEAKRRELLEDDLNASLSKYTGLRLIIEALIGGKFADLIDPGHIVEAMSGWPGEAQTFCREVHEFLNPASPEQSKGSSEDEVEAPYCNCLSRTDSPPLDGIRSQATDIQEGHSASHSGESSSTSEGAADGEYGEGDSGTWYPTAETTSYDEPTGWDNLCQDLEELSTETLKNEVADALQELEAFGRRKPTIIGHNQFMDLLFLYNTFIDDLPDTLGEFRAKIQRLFPYVIDTKLLAIKDDTIEGEDPLLDLHNRFDRNKTQPSISWDTAYGYGRRGTAHQAGFDSYMTAVVFLRIAHKLHRERTTRLESRLASHESKAKRLYDREWLLAVGYDPNLLGYLDNDTWRAPSTQEECVGRIRFGSEIFDDIYNRIRIAPRKTVYFGPD